MYNDQQQRARNNLSAMQSRLKRKEREEGAFKKVDELTIENTDLKIQLAGERAEKAVLRETNEFYQNYLVSNCMILPPLPKTTAVNNSD